MRYGAGKIGEFEGRLVSIADVVGDWREEIIVSVPGELRIYTTTIPTPRRRPALMQDPLYRKDVALQTMGYFYPAQLSYHFR
jgi:rhamnogalacturonan endolyase